MKVTIKLDKRTCKKNGEYPIKFMVSVGSETFYLPSGFSVLPRFWNEKACKLRSNALDADEINDYLDDKLTAYRKALRGQDEGLAVAEVKEILAAVDSKPVSHRLADVWAEFVVNKSGKTKGTYDYAWQKITAFSPHLDWDKFDYAWLLSFQKFMTDSGLGIDSRGIVLRCLRAVNNYALRCEYTTIYPFRSFQIATAPAAMRRKNELALTIEEIKRLWSLPLDSSLSSARNIWFLSFFLGGVNLIDLFQMAAPDDNLRLSYVRTKIKRFQPESVELDLSGFPEPLTVWLLSLGSDGFLIDRQGRDWMRFSDYQKKCLQKISVLFDKHINMYSARYSWATVAAAVGVSVDVIDRIQGHIGSGSLAEKYYIRFDWSRVRDALAVVARIIVE